MFSTQEWHRVCRWCTENNALASGPTTVWLVTKSPSHGSSVDRRNAHDWSYSPKLSCFQTDVAIRAPTGVLPEMPAVCKSQHKPLLKVHDTDVLFSQSMCTVLADALDSRPVRHFISCTAQRWSRRSWTYLMCVYVRVHVVRKKRFVTMQNMDTWNILNLGRLADHCNDDAQFWAKIGHTFGHFFKKSKSLHSFFADACGAGVTILMRFILWEGRTAPAKTRNCPV